jgi:VWFA-related protein
LYDGLRKVRHGSHDKKAILLLTDGEDTSSENTYDEAQRSVRESEVLVYCLGISPSGGGLLTERNPYPTGGGGPSGPNGPNGRRTPTNGPSIGLPFPGLPGGIQIPGIPGAGKRTPFPAFPVAQQFPSGRNTRVQAGEDTVDMNVLDGFADASGGKAWLLSGNWTDNRGSEIQGVLDEIASELRNQYSIGYYPSHDIKDGKWHRIEIRARNKRYQVRSRKEYFGQ